jgi:hypothetical protein
MAAVHEDLPPFPWTGFQERDYGRDDEECRQDAQHFVFRSVPVRPPRPPDRAGRRSVEAIFGDTQYRPCANRRYRGAPRAARGGCKPQKASEGPQKTRASLVKCEDYATFKGISKSSGGEGGIRTPDSLSAMSAFEAGAFNHSATSPMAATCVENIASL